MNLKYLAAAAAIATVTVSAAQAQTQTSPQPTQKMQQGSSTTAPHGKTGSTSGTVGSANHAGSGKSMKQPPNGAMQHNGTGNSTAPSGMTPGGTTSGGMSR